MDNKTIAEKLEAVANDLKKLALEIRESANISTETSKQKPIIAQDRSMSG